MFRRTIASLVLLAGMLSFSPAAIADGGEVAASTGFDGGRLSAGYAHACVVADGNVYCWGSNSLGQLGQHPSSIVTANTPMKVQGISGATAVAAGRNHTCAIATGGNVWCWGEKTWAAAMSGGGSQHTPTQVSGVTGAVAITAGDSHTCVLTNSAAVLCWGENPSGQLGNGGSNTTTPTAVTLANAVAIAAGSAHTCAVLASGNVKCWGSNFMGQLGNSSNSNSASPVTVLDNAGASLANAVSISAGYWHSCATTSDNHAYCWGDNMYSELGTPQSSLGGSSTKAYAVRAGRSNAAEASDVVGVSAGEYYSCMLRTTGAVACFGQNDVGQVGNGVSGTNSDQGPDTTSTVSGVQVVTTGRNFSCALSATSLWCWGAGSLGQMGNSTNTSSATPVSNIGFRTQSVTFAAPADTSVTSGTVAISASSGSGATVVFSSLTTAVCTVSGTTVTLVSPGTCTVRASAPASAMFAASENVDRSFTVSGSKPTARTASATSLSSTRATLNAAVNANGLSTTVNFVWGKKSDLSDGATESARAATGLADTDVSVTVTGLEESTRYYYRVEATNSLGAAKGDIVSFTSGRPVGITVNDADEFTNKKAVTVYATGPSGSTQVMISNDGGFGSARTFSLTDSYAEIPWTLVASRDERLPKTVYARFVQRFGSQSANYSDDIILDTTAPVMSSASAASSAPASGNVTVQAVRASAAGGVKLTVRAKDANSGIGKVQVKGSSGGSAVDVATSSPKASSRTVRVNTTKKKLWVRVVDRAGNVSKWVSVTVK